MPSLFPRSIGLIIGSSVAAVLVYWVAKETLSSRPQIIPSPRKAVSKLSKDEQDALPYPPNAFPGARDVDSPYGSIRVYEFGPETGRKVLIIHGISTPCISLSSLAHGLVSKGCRVLLLDLFGRGYSDSVDLPHDSRLYISQILLAIMSSPIPWTPEGFSIIGYSFGGGIAVDLAVGLKGLVKSLVLLAPGGLIRERHFNWQSKAMFSGWVPPQLLEWIVSRRLGGNEISKPVMQSGNEERPTTGDEIKGNRDAVFESTVITPSRPDVTIGKVVEWQLRNHEGFVKSFISSMRYGPTTGGKETWKRLGERGDKVLIVVGSEDSVINAKELREDAIDTIEEENVEWRVVEAAHEFPISKAGEVLDMIEEFWGL